MKAKLRDLIEVAHRVRMEGGYEILLDHDDEGRALLLEFGPRSGVGARSRYWVRPDTVIEVDDQGRANAILHRAPTFEGDSLVAGLTFLMLRPMTSEDLRAGHRLPVDDAAEPLELPAAAGPAYAALVEFFRQHGTSMRAQLRGHPLCDLSDEPTVRAVIEGCFIDGEKFDPVSGLPRLVAAAAAEARRQGAGGVIPTDEEGSGLAQLLRAVQRQSKAP